MVKGVNKTIIEISDTGSKYFERVLFFVRPEQSGLPQARLERRALEYIEESCLTPECLKKRKHRKAALLALLAVGVVTAAVLIVFL